MINNHRLIDVATIINRHLQGSHEQRGDVPSVSHGERPLSLQSVDEGQQEHLVVEELTEETQSFLHVRWRLKHKHSSLIKSETTRLTEQTSGPFFSLDDC